MSRAILVQLPDAARWNLVRQEMTPLRCDGLDAQLLEERFQIGIVDRNFGLWLALGRRFDEAFIEGLEKAHFGHGVFFAAGKGAAVLLSPCFESGLIDENLKAEGGLAVDGNSVGELAAEVAVALGAVPFEEIVLIHVAVGGGVALDATNGIRTRHGGLFVDGVRMSTSESGRSEVPKWH
jgi:hypothetical protein